ncbi:MAG: major capsid protein [Alphaproteobacteria bacterium]
MGISMPNMTFANVFTGNAFSAVTLTTNINNVPFTPNLLGDLGLYYVDGVRTTDIAINERGGKLEIIKTSPRGAPPETTTHAKSKMRKATAVHIAVEDTVTADEAQDAINSASMMGQPQLQAANDLLQERMEGPIGLRQRIELTHEYHRMGGIQGIVVDQDGSELYNWYDFFGLPTPDPININFGALTADGGVFEVKCTEIKRTLKRALGGLPITTMRPVVLCGDNYFDQVYSNKETKAARKNRDTGRENDVFTRNMAFDSFIYGGVTWINYQGTDDGKVGIDKDVGRLFPFGVPGLFQQLFAPPDIYGMTSVKGMPVFAYMPPEKQTSKQATIEAQSNPLTLCLRPGALIEMTK